MMETPGGSTERDSREAGDRTCDRWFTRHSAYPLHHGGGNNVFTSSAHYLHLLFYFAVMAYWFKSCKYIIDV